MDVRVFSVQVPRLRWSLMGLAQSTLGQGIGRMGFLTTRNQSPEEIWLSVNEMIDFVL